MCDYTFWRCPYQSYTQGCDRVMWEKSRLTPEEIAEAKKNVQRGQDAEVRANIDRNRGIYPTLEEQNRRGLCDLDREPHPHYTKCVHWARTPPNFEKLPETKILVPKSPAKPVLGTCAICSALHEIGECCVEWKSNSALVVSEDYQKNLRTFRADMGNPIDDEKTLRRSRIESRLDELAYVSAMDGEVQTKDWFKRRVTQLKKWRMELS
jgi:hypothetical protein